MLELKVGYIFNSEIDQNESILENIESNLYNEGYKTSVTYIEDSKVITFFIRNETTPHIYRASIKKHIYTTDYIITLIVGDYMASLSHP